MPDSHFPPRTRTLIRWHRAVEYLFLSGMGLAGIIWHPPVSSSHVGIPATYYWAGLVALGSIGCMVSIMLRRYRVEWVLICAVWGGCFAYVVTLWSVVGTGRVVTIATACGISYVTVTLSRRWVELHAHAAFLRALHAPER